MINRTQRRVVRLTLKPQAQKKKILFLIQIEPVDYFLQGFCIARDAVSWESWNGDIVLDFTSHFRQSLLLVGLDVNPYLETAIQY